MRVSDVLAGDPGQPLAVNRTDWLLIPDSTPLAELRHVATSRGESDSTTVIAVMKNINEPASCIGFMETEDFLEG